MLKKQLAEVAALAAQFTNSTPPAAAPTTRPTAATDFDEAFRSLVLEVAEIDPADYRPDADLREDLALDSLDLIELIMLCEKDFHMIIPDREWMKIRTVEELRTLVTARLAQPQLASCEAVAPASGQGQ